MRARKGFEVCQASFSAGQLGEIRLIRHCVYLPLLRYFVAPKEYFEALSSHRL